MSVRLLKKLSLHCPYPISYWVWLSFSSSFSSLLPQNSPQSHNFIFFLSRCLFVGRVQATAAHAAQPEPGLDPRAAQGQGKNRSPLISTVKPVRKANQVIGIKTFVWGVKPVLSYHAIFRHLVHFNGYAGSGRSSAAVPLPSKVKALIIVSIFGSESSNS